MTTKKVILLSSVTYLAINITTWLLGWLIWPVIFIGAWAGSGYLGRYIYKTHTNDSSDLWMFLLFGPIWLACILNDYWPSIKRDLTFLPKFRNPFVWPEK